MQGLKLNKPEWNLPLVYVSVLCSVSKEAAPIQICKLSIDTARWYGRICLVLRSFVHLVGKKLLSSIELEENESQRGKEQHSESFCFFYLHLTAEEVDWVCWVSGEPSCWEKQISSRILFFGKGMRKRETEEFGWRESARTNLEDLWEGVSGSPPFYPPTTSTTGLCSKLTVFILFHFIFEYLAPRVFTVWGEGKTLREVKETGAKC